MSRNAQFYQQMAAIAAEQRNNDFRNGWNEAMGEVMLHDKPWTDPQGARLARAKTPDQLGPVTVTKPKQLPPKPTEGLTYVAGPMSNVGPPTWNYPAFMKMATRLRQKGIQVISPHELHDADPTVPWDRYLRADLEVLAKCTRVVFLPGWAKSRGATLEHQVAVALGMELVYPEDIEEWLRAR